jgi:plastocyanin
VRRHPLIARPICLLRGVLATLVLAAGVTACSTATPPQMAAVTIASAAGEVLAFEPAEASAPAGGPIRITFRNGSSLAHNLVFTAGLSAATRTIVDPGTSDELLLTGTAPGRYPFACTIHDGMRGSLIVIGSTGRSDTPGG